MRPIHRWLMAVFGLLVFASLGVVYHLNTNPLNTIPRQILPVPNAFDYDVKAGDALLEGDKMQEALGIARYGSSGNLLSYTLSQKAALIRENAPSLKLIRSGFAFTYLSPQRSESDPFPYYRQFRILSYLLRLEGEVKASHGDWGGATLSDLDALRFGNDIPHGGGILGSGIGAYCQQEGRKPFWGQVSHLTAKQAKDAALNLEAIQAKQIPFADTMQQEEWSGQAELLKIFHIQNWRQTLVKDASSTMIDSNGARLALLQLQTKLMITSKQAMYADYTRYMDQYIRIARSPYAAKLPVQPMRLDPLHSFLFSFFPDADYSTMRLPETKCQTENVLLLVTLALHAYQLDHGALPNTLQGLVPTYLHKVPDDPFALSGPLRYQLKGQQFVLYSVGPDGKDDDGIPVYDPAQPLPRKPGAFNRRYWVTDTSKGDIVGGINLD